MIDLAVGRAAVDASPAITPRKTGAGMTVLYRDRAVAGRRPARLQADATGATASAACRVARELGARRVVVEAPVGGPDAIRRVQSADDVICLIQPRDFRAVGGYYEDFGQTSEAEVVKLLQDARQRVERTPS